MKTPAKIELFAPSKSGHEQHGAICLTIGSISKEERRRIKGQARVVFSGNPRGGPATGAEKKPPPQPGRAIAN